MTNFISSQEAITKKVMQLGEINYTKQSYDKARLSWWKNIRKHGGLGLTVVGDEQFRSVGLEYWDLPCGSTATILERTHLSFALDQSMICPFFLCIVGSSRTVRVYDSRIATIIALHGGIYSYIATLPKRKELM